MNPDQEKRIDSLALTLFIPRSQGRGETSLYFSRRELIRRFGKPLGSKSVEVEANPQNPTDDTIWERTTWEFPGVRITTRAEAPGTDALRIEEGEIYGANAPVRGDLRIGQSIELWVPRFGRPACRTRQYAPFGRDHVAYDATFFACADDRTPPCVGPYEVELYLDAAGRIERMKWMLVPGH